MKNCHEKLKITYIEDDIWNRSYLPSIGLISELREDLSVPGVCPLGHQMKGCQRLFSQKGFLKILSYLNNFMLENKFKKQTYGIQIVGTETEASSAHHVSVHALEPVIVVVVLVVVVIVVVVVVQVVEDVHDGVDGDEQEGEEGEGVETGLWRTAGRPG
jgi:hypothetical protein